MKQPGVSNTHGAMQNKEGRSELSAFSSFTKTIN